MATITFSSMSQFNLCFRLMGKWKYQRCRRTWQSRYDSWYHLEAHTSFGRDIIYYIIWISLCYIILHLVNIEIPREAYHSFVSFRPSFSDLIGQGSSWSSISSLCAEVAELLVGNVSIHSNRKWQSRREETSAFWFLVNSSNHVVTDVNICGFSYSLELPGKQNMLASVIRFCLPYHLVTIVEEQNDLYHYLVTIGEEHRMTCTIIWLP